MTDTSNRTHGVRYRVVRNVFINFQRVTLMVSLELSSRLQESSRRIPRGIMVIICMYKILTCATKVKIHSFDRYCSHWIRGIRLHKYYRYMSHVDACTVLYWHHIVCQLNRSMVKNMRIVTREC